MSSMLQLQTFKRFSEEIVKNNYMPTGGSKIKCNKCKQEIQQITFIAEKSADTRRYGQYVQLALCECGDAVITSSSRRAAENWVKLLTSGW